MSYPLHYDDAFQETTDSDSNNDPITYTPMQQGGHAAVTSGEGTTSELWVDSRSLHNFALIYETGHGLQTEASTKDRMRDVANPSCKPITRMSQNDFPGRLHWRDMVGLLLIEI